jgi:hypothetical protein
MLGIARCQIAHRKQPWLRKNITLCRKDHVDRKDCVNRKTNHANSKDHVARTVAKKLEQKRSRHRKKINKPIGLKTQRKFLPPIEMGV